MATKALSVKFTLSFKPAIELIKKNIDEKKLIRIVTHTDSDGLASGGILSRMVHRLGARWKTSCINSIDENSLIQLKKEKNPLILFSDFGSGYLKIIDEKLPHSEVVILDHHLPEEHQSDNIIQINPMLHNIDGSREIAASGVCYMFAKETDERNIDLSILGIVGALGDQQDKGDRNSLIGLNKLIEKDSIDQNLLKKRVDILLYGYETRPIARALAYTTNPFIPGLSGREDQCVAFLNDLGISLKQNSRWRALRDLSEEEKQSIFSALSNHLLSEDVKASSIHNLAGTIYTLKKEKDWTSLRDGREFSSLLNACARMKNPSLGISICLGDRGNALREAEEIMEQYRKKIASHLQYVNNEKIVHELENIYLIKGENLIEDTLIGVIAGILQNQGIFERFKPVIATAYTEDGRVKVSGRSSEELVHKGLHLGKAMQETAKLFDGNGGGHDIAAGAYIPLQKENEFVKEFNKTVPTYYTN
jgi:RecJ-like exonuclease